MNLSHQPLQLASMLGTGCVCRFQFLSFMSSFQFCKPNTTYAHSGKLRPHSHFISHGQVASVHQNVLASEELFFTWKTVVSKEGHGLIPDPHAVIFLLNLPEAQRAHSSSRSHSKIVALWIANKWVRGSSPNICTAGKTLTRFTRVPFSNRRVLCRVWQLVPHFRRDDVLLTHILDLEIS